jgi:hypothetical protein
MSSVTEYSGPIHLGLDNTSKNTIAVGILRWGEQVPDTEMLFNDEASVRRLVDRQQGTVKARRSAASALTPSCR